MITTESDDSEKEKALNSGANGYLVKPVTGDEIAQKINIILETIFPKGGFSNA